MNGTVRGFLAYCSHLGFDAAIRPGSNAIDVVAPSGHEFMVSVGSLIVKELRGHVSPNDFAEILCEAQERAEKVEE